MLSGSVSLPSLVPIAIGIGSFLSREKNKKNALFEAFVDNLHLRKAYVCTFGNQYLFFPLFLEKS